MSDLIDRQELIRDIDSLGEDFINFYKLMILISKLPTAEPVERTAKVKINWATHSDENGVNIIRIPYAYRCGNCDSLLKRTNSGMDIHYCPSCGAKLIWGKE